jgi:tripartite-type tricarboxylate transporter receptor subunit TctC
MEVPRRTFLQLARAAVVASASPRLALALDYPTRPVRIIGGFSAGNAADIAARLIAQWLSQRLGQQFIVEDRPGTAGNIGTEVVVRAPPDGYTLLLITSANAFSATLYQNLKFDFIRDIAPVASICAVPYVIVVNPSLPAKTIPEFIAYAKANPGKINMASAGIGSANHVFGELFQMMTGVEMVHVPFRGDYMADLLGGRVQVLFSPMAASLDYIRSGKLHALAVTTPTRVQALPDIPAVDEFVPGYAASGWLGIGAPKGTPAEIVEKLNGDINAIDADPAFDARLAALGDVPMPKTAAGFRRLIADETEKWGKVIRAAHIKAD